MCPELAKQTTYMKSNFFQLHQQGLERSSSYYKQVTLPLNRLPQKPRARFERSSDGNFKVVNFRHLFPFILPLPSSYLFEKKEGTSELNLILAKFKKTFQKFSFADPLIFFFKKRKNIENANCFQNRNSSEKNN